MSEIPAGKIWKSVDDMILAAQGGSRSSEYLAASPFPHVVLDGFMPSPLLEALSDEFPEASDMSIQFKAKLQVKSAEQCWDRMGPATRTALAGFNSGPFVALIEELTGIAPLVADPYLDGGGQHQTVRGGKLGIHADFSRSERLGLERRVNVLFYLTPDWDEAWGGHLELWDPTMTNCVRRIAPLYGRCVVFTTTASSFHGVPDPLACPAGTSRKSLALYYYSTGLAKPGSPEHRAIFRRRPGSNDPEVTTIAEEGLSLGRVGTAILPPILVGPTQALYRRLKRGRKDR